MVKLLHKNDDGKFVVVEQFTLTIGKSQVFERDGESITYMPFGKFITSSGVKGSFIYGCNPMTSIPSSISENDLTLTLDFQVDDIFSISDRLLIDSSYSEDFSGIMSSGKLISDKSLENQVKIIKNSVINNEPLEVPAITYELILSLIARSRNNPSKPWRLDKKSEYTLDISFRGLAAVTGTAQSVTFEDPSAMCLISSTRKDSENTNSSLEYYMKL
jgi:hypothetical protein